MIVRDQYPILKVLVLTDAGWFACVSDNNGNSRSIKLGHPKKGAVAELRAMGYPDPKFSQVRVLI